MLADSAKLAAIEQIGPTKYDLIRVFGEDSYWEDPETGEWRVYIVKKGLTRHQNMLRQATFDAMMQGQRDAVIERSAEKDQLHADNGVPVIDPTGRKMVMPLRSEPSLAKKNGWRPWIKWKSLLRKD